jgi:hypothetical protein
VRFQLQRYAEWMRDTCAPCLDPWPELLDAQRQLVVGPAGFLRELAHLLARGLLDTRFDSLLIPVFLRQPCGDLAGTLQSGDWGLPAGFWSSRLGDGAAILLIEAGPRDAQWIDAAVEAWPRCRFIVASETPLALRGWATSPRTSSEPSA